MYLKDVSDCLPKSRLKFECCFVVSSIDAKTFVKSSVAVEDNYRDLCVTPRAVFQNLIYRFCQLLWSVPELALCDKDILAL